LLFVDVHDLAGPHQPVHSAAARVVAGQRFHLGLELSEVVVVSRALGAPVKRIDECGRSSAGDVHPGHAGTPEHIVRDGDVGLRHAHAPADADLATPRLALFPNTPFAAAFGTWLANVTSYDAGRRGC